MHARRLLRSLAFPLAFFVIAAVVAVRFAGVGSGRAGAELPERAEAARRHAAVRFHELACNTGSAIDCGIAAAMLREGDADDLARAAVLGARAYAAFDPERAPPSLPGDDADRTAQIRGRERACELGDAESCKVAARLAAGDGQPWRVAALYQLACDARDPSACETALRARQAARRGGVHVARAR